MKYTSKIFISVVLLSILPCSGCVTTLTPAARQIHSSDERMVANCEFLGEVQGSSGFGNLAATQGMQNARNEAMEQAAQLGATNIVWTNIAGGFSPYATGRAYRCK